MAAHASTHAPRSWSLITRLKAFVGRVEFDQRLAAGTDPAASPELARRAQVLSRWRVQHALADAHPPGTLRAVAFQAAFNAEAD
jgi:hypothetical protein